MTGPASEGATDNVAGSVAERAAERLGERAAERLARRLPEKAALAVGAVGVGLLLGWAVHSRSLLLVILAGALAAMNGYSKAYSP